MTVTSKPFCLRKRSWPRSRRRAVKPWVTAKQIRGRKVFVHVDAARRACKAHFLVVAMAREEFER